MGNDIFYSGSIKLATQQDIEEINKANTIKSAYRIMQNLSLNEISYDNAVKILEMFNKENI